MILLDGTFLFENVPIGDYYLAADVAGYVDEGLVIRETVREGGDSLRKGGLNRSVQQHLI